MINIILKQHIACNLSALSKTEKLEHLQLSIQVLSKIPIEKIETQNGFQFIFDDNEENFFQVTNWIYFEHKCCPWALFEFSTPPSKLILEMKSNSAEGKLFFKSNLDYINSLKESQKLNEEQVSKWQAINKKNNCGC